MAAKAGRGGRLNFHLCAAASSFHQPLYVLIRIGVATAMKSGMLRTDCSARPSPAKVSSTS